MKLLFRKWVACCDETTQDQFPSALWNFFSISQPLILLFRFTASRIAFRRSAESVRVMDLHPELVKTKTELKNESKYWTLISHV